MKYSFICGMIAALSLCLVAQCFAVTLNVDTVLGPDHPYPNQTITVIDGADPPTEVTILDGTIVGNAPSGAGLDIYGQSIVTMFGGGAIGSPAVLLHDNSVFHMLGGDIERQIEAYDSSEVIVDGGFWRGVDAFGSSVIRIAYDPFGNSYPLRLRDQSHAIITEGGVLLFADDSSTALIKRGYFDSALAQGDTRWLITGGAFSFGLRVAGGVVRIRGIEGEGFGEEGLLVSGGTAHIYGFGLRFDVHDEFGPIIVGKLADGDDFGARYRIFDPGQIILHEVPEPAASSLALLGIAALARARFARRRRAQ